MANTSILNAFERMWHHVTIALSNKAAKSEIPTKTSDLVNDSSFATAGHIMNISLFENLWAEEGSIYKQVVTVNNITAKSKIDLQPTLDQLYNLMEYGISMQAINENGIVTVYANNKPTIDYTMQIIVTEINEEV